MTLFIADRRIMIHKINASCTLLKRQIVLHFTQYCKRDTVPSFITELRLSVQKRQRGERYLYSRNLQGYELNLRSRRITRNLRVFIDLLATQLCLIRNFELEGPAINISRHAFNFIRELRLELQHSEFRLVNWRVE